MNNKGSLNFVGMFTFAMIIVLFTAGTGYLVGYATTAYNVTPLLLSTLTAALKPPPSPGQIPRQGNFHPDYLDYEPSGKARQRAALFFFYFYASTLSKYSWQYDITRHSGPDCSSDS